MSARGSALGFRRRCCWCAVQLRGWQLNACRGCKRAIVYSPSPAFPSRSRWDAEPDSFPIEVRR